MLLPLGAYLLAASSARPGRDLVRLALPALLVGAACFAPVFLVYGPEALTFVDRYPPLSSVLFYISLGVWGPLGFAALAVLALLIALRGRDSLAQLHGAPRRAALWLALPSILIYTALYLRVPYEAGYLVPMLPFAFLLLGMLARPTWLRVFCVLVIVSPFFPGLTRSGPTLAGPILRDHQKRSADQRLARAAIDVAATLPEPALIVAGLHYPRIRVELGGDGQGPHRYVYLIEGDGDYDRLVAEGRTVYYLPRSERFNANIYGLDLGAKGARPLPLQSSDSGS
jgi:hypothetical protein